MSSLPPAGWFPGFTPSLQTWQDALAAHSSPVDGLVAETAARIAGDATEAAARTAAVSSEASARVAAVGAEATARQTADQLEATMRDQAIAAAVLPLATGQSLLTEVSNRQTVDAQIVATINNEVNARIAAIAAILTGQGLYFPTGVDPTGQADSSPAIQAAIDAVAARPAGGIVQLPGGVFKIGSTLNIRKSGVQLCGVGTGAFHDVNPLAQSSTLLIWAGSAGGTMLSIGPVVATSSQKLTGIKVAGLALQGSADFVTPGAAYGMIATSVQHSVFDLYTVEFTTAAVAIAVVASGIAEAANAEGNTLSLRFRQINQSGTALQLGGSSQGNSCFNTFPVVYGYIKNGIGIDFQDCDNNTVERAWIDRINGGAGTNAYFRSNGGGMSGCARANNIIDFSGSVHSNVVYAEGTEKSGATTASYANRIERWDSSNAGLNLVTGIGATIFTNNNTSPIGLLESNSSDTFAGYETSTPGVIQFWGSTGNLGVGTSTYPVGNFGCSRILEVSATPLTNSSTPGVTSCTNWANRSDGRTNVFDLYTSQGGFFSFRGRARR